MSDIELAKKLWALLDDIDTASDVFKPSDEESYKAFYEHAMRKQEERHKYLQSDGYKLYRIGDKEFATISSPSPTMEYNAT